MLMAGNKDDAQQARKNSGQLKQSPDASKAGAHHQGPSRGIGEDGTGGPSGQQGNERQSIQKGKLSIMSGVGQGVSSPFFLMSPFRLSQLDEKTKKLMLEIQQNANFILNSVKKEQVAERSGQNTGQLLKLIATIYQEYYKLIKKDEHAGVPLHVLIYQIFTANYGLKKIAEKKCYDFLVKVKRSYHTSHKLEMFVKLLNLAPGAHSQSALSSPKEIEFYLRTVLMLDELNHPDRPFQNFERSKTNVVRAIEVARLLFQDMLSDAEINNIINQLSIIKQFDIDIVSDIFLNIYVQLKGEKQAKYSPLFEMISSDEQGAMIDLPEFYLLLKHVNHQPDLSLAAAEEVFNRYCNGYSESKSNLTLNQVTFMELCEEQGVLTQ